MDIDIPNSLLEEQGRQMYAAKLIELQVQTETYLCACNTFKSLVSCVNHLISYHFEIFSELYDVVLPSVILINLGFL